jgi:hypothetical protein
MTTQHSATIKKVCAFITEGDISAAENAIRTEYPFTPMNRQGRSYTPREMTRVFMRDGFIDRYRGTHLIYPPVLRVISIYLSDSFPYHKNGKMDLGHIAYWELFPTIDHVVPVARGGPDSENNWVCCSMLTNSIKSNWTLEQLQWELLPPGSWEEWDGMMPWFIQQVERDQNLLNIAYIKRWFYAARETMHNNVLNAGHLSR